jgi:hypothetical protein
MSLDIEGLLYETETYLIELSEIDRLKTILILND